MCCILSKAVAKAASGAPRQQFHPAPGLPLLSMAGYLSESDFVMVEEGFSTRDLLEELTLGASQATTVRGWKWVWVDCLSSLCRRPLVLSFGFGIYLIFSRLPPLSPILGPCPTPALPVFSALRKEQHHHSRSTRGGNLGVPAFCSLPSYRQAYPAL